MKTKEQIMDILKKNSIIKFGVITDSKYENIANEILFPEEPSQERFTKPTDKQLVEIALLFNDGKIRKSKLRDMVAMAEFIVDRLYENGKP
jgi:hypothetical protein